MTAINTLITSISAKVQLIELFASALGAYPGSRLVGADADPLAAARHNVDAFAHLPADDDPGYGDAIVDLCTRHQIRLIIPTRDNELVPLARLKPRLDAIGVVVPVPGAGALSNCLDKLKFHDFCLDRGFPVLPRREPKDDSDFPVFVRLTSSAGSRSAFLVPDMAIWRQLHLEGDRYICQPLCRDEEFSVDVLMDLDGQPLQAVARRRERIVYGESWRSQVVRDPELEQLALDVCTAMGLRGHNLVQAFRSKDAGINLIEANARFGGCSNLSVVAGLASPARLLAMVAGDKGGASAARDIRYGLRSNRHARDMFEDSEND